MDDKEKLIELISEYHEAWKHGEGDWKRGLADAILADGWRRPPCKVGATLYVIPQIPNKRLLPVIGEYEATSIKIGKKKCLVYHELDGYIKIFTEEDFGETVFLTRKDAENAIKEKQR